MTGAVYDSVLLYTVFIITAAQYYCDIYGIEYFY